MKNFQRRDLNKEFYAERSLVRLEAMRGTLFITSAKSAPMLYQATKPPESEILRAVHRRGITLSEYYQLTERCVVF